MTEAATTRKLGTADIARVMKLLPHRYPFLMVDKIIDMDADVQEDRYAISKE
jgi:3-hydroxyacyl-[acyl-carrier-protein] dehydratase